YSDAYNDAMDARQEPWETLTQDVADARYVYVLDDANKQLTDGRDELEENRKKGEKDLQDAKKKLDDGKKELEDSRRKLDDGKLELERSAKTIGDSEKQLADSEKQIADGEKQLADGKKELDAAEKQLADAKKLIDEKRPEIEKGKLELDEAKKTLDDSEKQLNDAKAQLDQGKQELEDGKAQLAAAEEELTAKEDELNDNEAYLLSQEEEIKKRLENRELIPLDQIKEMTEGLVELAKAHIQISEGKRAISDAWTKLGVKKSEINDGRVKLVEAEMQYQQGLSEFNAGKRQYEAALREYESGRTQFDKGVKEYEQGLAEYESGKAEYERNVQKLADGRQQLEAGKKALADGKKRYEEGIVELEDGEKKYADGVEQYEKGLKEYEDGKAKFDREIAKAERKIEDAEKTVSDIRQPDTYVLDRYTNVGYSSFESDSDIVGQVAKVFPLFFILVAALVCMTTMSRMVAEQRTGIGTLKALGYSEAAIMGKFAFYAGSAASLGCVVGFAVGTVVFPFVIWMSYQLMYIPMQLEFVFDWKLALLALTASLLCSIGTTWLSCRIELKAPASELMRPKAPRPGKRVLLEYLPFIWNRLPFLYKVSIRNIFRYKGRFFMMIVGIGGCMALLLTGFGLRDSVADFAEVQYTEVFVSDAEMRLRDITGTDLPPELTKLLDAETEQYTRLNQSSMDLVYGTQTKSVHVIAAFAPEEFDMNMNLHTVNGEPLTFPANGETYVSNSVHERFGVNLGDMITLRNEDMQEVQVKVTGIFENHVYNYALVTSETLESQIGKKPDCNSLAIKFPEGTDVYQAQTKFANEEHISLVVLYQDLRDRMAKMMGALDYVVLLVIGCAAGLAFIVLYNLTNINITERIREVATIKVLGFFKKETKAYVLRENLALTALGVIVGLFLGVILHRFVIAQIVVDLVSFKVQILPMSFVWSVVLTFCFNAFVNFVMGFKLEKINMAESLKSVD
ncbi:MAG: FtsX-like permease family protein, partial [Oscillospiraceae bacterium]|nr:FtsX-like permease family protein [Oscillospiraceae bacterium]